MKKAEKKLLEEILRQEKQDELLIKGLWGEVLEASELNHIIQDGDSLGTLLNKVKEIRSEILTEEQMAERCVEIHKNIFKELPDNYEVNLCKHLFISSYDMRELGDIIIKIKMVQDSTPHYICLNSEKVLDATVYFGGPQRKAYIAFKNEEGSLVCSEILEFQLLSLTKETRSNQEYGFLISHHWLTAKVQTTTLTGWNLDVLKNFMLGEWFQMLMNDENTAEIKKEEVKKDE